MIEKIFILANLLIATWISYVLFVRISYSSRNLVALKGQTDRKNVTLAQTIFGYCATVGLACPHDPSISGMEGCIGRVTSKLQSVKRINETAYSFETKHRVRKRANVQKARAVGKRRKA